MARELRVVEVSDPNSLIGPLGDALAGSGPAVFPYMGATPKGSPELVDDQVALVVETSGSTATPKRVWHTAESLRAASAQSMSALGAPGVWWLALPAHYIAGVMVIVRALEPGGKLLAKDHTVPISVGLRAFHQSAFDDYPGIPRYTSLVPKQISDLLDAAESDPELRDALAGFERILVGGQRVPDELVHRAQSLGVIVTKTYGSAETAGGCVWDGVPLGETEVDIVDGAVTLSGPMLAGGYLGDPTRTKERFVVRHDRTWYFTDDAGAIVDGVLQVSGRIDRTIISGGLKVNLDELEDTLHGVFPSYEWVAVGVADPTWGDVPVMVGALSASRISASKKGAEEAQQMVSEAAALSLDQVQEAISRILGRHVVPRQLVMLDVIPRLPSGKVDRRAVADHVIHEGGNRLHHRE
ncbi:O-succinylbenzoic acid--CoA ligase [Pontimonas salivibrio]|uniref:O-succinylbenzoic acid--CoA ligase n=1 Tax=Pontimonas salivibrio TaxID=1159327 RepID=A0A2L2BSS6_9MICO|nr:AMP-binding protein [Pontimonas salivibrio]AVG24701.1 O-succinylbenzoic acid--CoA ligase [Pontimonas salivibrio]